MFTGNRKYLLSFVLLLCLSNLPEHGLCRNNDDSLKFHPARFYGLLGGSLLTYSASMTVLYQFWYADYPQSDFHFFNDSREWLQVDKTGHFFSSYYESVIGINTLKWTGMKENRAILYGSLWGILLQSPIEIFDGYSANWGFSVADMTANVAGSLFAFAQQKLWNEQKLQLKFSFLPSNMASKRTDLLGSTMVEQLIKDYNGETYWLSTGIRNIVPKAEFIPKWLNISVGYGAQNLLGGFENPVAYQYLKRYRQIYLSFDVNTLKLKGKSRFLNSVLTAVSFIKFPSPTLEFNSDNSRNVRFHWLYF
jgi:uncharacterized protein YfiM (DUF2279 family)